MANIINVEWTQSNLEMNCPCCRSKAIASNGLVVSATCPHFLFSWNDEIGDFVDCVESVEQASIQAGALANATEPEFVDSLPTSANLFRIEIRDHADGPVVETRVHAFDPLAA